MAEQLEVPTTTVAAVRERLGRGRAGLEDAGSAAPRSVDAGDLTPLLTGMLDRVVGHAATLSEGLEAISGQVAETARALWEADTDVAACYSRPGVTRGD